jgi:hypothetical protein
VVSKDIAAGTPTETVILQDGPDDKGANSDTGSSHGESMPHRALSVDS